MAEKAVTTDGVRPSLPDAGMKAFFEDMKWLVLLDMDALLAVHKRNQEALEQAGRAAMEGAELVVRRHMEIVQEVAAGLTGAVKDLSFGRTPASHIARQTELLKAAYESAVANTTELGDLIQRSSAEAVGRLNARFSEAMDEVTALLEKR
ncbi:phasin family protein [Acidocella sp.]|uniref:phasin family protein n=1 Tax=Acidocella sp. TaxID=50710 RepID=UPI00261E77A5|nr:TIGR01841 family phasin [Acidocella sp.]